MLRITVIERLTERILVLEGKLTKPYIAEVESAWQKACGASPVCSCVVDLRNTTFIDQSGERILLDMKQNGARFIACGVSTTDQLHRIGISCSEPSTQYH
jgi:anti-anti-sigma regulatory factor